MKYNPNAHKERRSTVHGLFWFIGLIMILIYAYGCSPQRGGCHATRGMSGYGWIKCKETNKVWVLAPDGSIVCYYYESIKSRTHE